MLSDAGERLRLITETSQDVFCFFDLDGVFVYVSPAIVPVLGFTPEELVGAHFRSFFEPAEAASATELFVRVAGGERIPPVEVTARGRDGQAVPLEVAAVPVVRDGATVGVYGIARDVTRRRRAEEGMRWYSGHLERLLKESDERERSDRERFAARLRRHHDTEAALRADQDMLRAAIETSPLGIAIAAVDGSLLWASRRFRELGSRAERPLAGVRLADLVHSDDRTAVAAVEREVASGRVDFGRIDARFAAGASRQRVAHISLALVRHATGQPRYLVVAAEGRTVER